MPGTPASSLVRKAKVFWQEDDRQSARRFLEEAEKCVSPKRIYELLGVRLTKEIYGREIQIKRRKSVVVIA